MGQMGQGPQAAPATFVAPPASPIAVPSPIFVPLEPFTVTLQNPDTERIMHVGLTLRVSDEQTRTRLEKYMPEVRSRILMVLSSQSPIGVQTQQGKTDMANAIKQAVNRPFSPLPDGQYVTDVLFTAFVVQ
jgi:flagellar FliL protein